MLFQKQKIKIQTMGILYCQHVVLPFQPKPATLGVQNGSRTMVTNCRFKGKKLRFKPCHIASMLFSPSNLNLQH
jgi:hypothetical protein